MAQKLEYTVLGLIEDAVRGMKAMPLNLGGIAGAGGGLGGPPGGFIGTLVQTRVAYDQDEIASSGIPASGMSLLDNLNHIRYRLNTISSGILIVDESDGSPSVSNVNRVTFSGAATVTNLGGGHALITITASGGGGGAVASVDGLTGAVDLSTRYLKLDSSNDPVIGPLEITSNEVDGIDIIMGGTTSHDSPGLYIQRVGNAHYTQAAIMVDDFEVDSVYRSTGATLLHWDVDGNELVYINPYPLANGTVVIFDTDTALTTGKILSLRVQQTEKVYVTAGGTVNIPTGETYNINGSAHAHSLANGIAVLGSTYSISASGAWEDTGLSVTLPSAGTYALDASVRAGVQNNGAGTFISVKLYNSTDAADVANSEGLAVYSNAANLAFANQISLTGLITVAASKVIKLYAFRVNSGTYTISNIDSDSNGRTRLRYIKVG